MKRFATCVAALFLCVPLAFGQDSQPSQQISGKIKSLAENQLTLTTSDGDQTCQLSTEKDTLTRIVLAGKKASQTNLKEDQQVTVSFSKLDGGKLRANLICDKASQIRGKIKSIAEDGKQITVTADGKDHQFQVQTPPTMLVASTGKQSQISDMRAGQEVSVIYMRAEDQNTALEIRQQK